MELSYSPKLGADEGIELEFFFHNEPNEAFRLKMLKFLNSLTPIFPFLKQMRLSVRSSNSFPHSAGIASSASSMSALALCLCTLEDNLFGTLKEDKTFRQKASFIARLGSGSACRSVYEGLAVWGETIQVEGSSDLYAVEYAPLVHEVFNSFHDDILIVGKGEKSVSSTAGHALMEGNIYASNRYQQAKIRMNELLSALKSGDLQTFGKIAEQEALTLHAMMMASNPPYILMLPGSLEVIRKVQEYRKDTGHPVYFSLDAGPNIHLLYPDSIAAPVNDFIENELVALCENGQVIRDQVGKGPLEMS